MLYIIFAFTLPYVASLLSEFLYLVSLPVTVIDAIATFTSMVFYIIGFTQLISESKNFATARIIEIVLLIFELGRFIFEKEISDIFILNAIQPITVVALCYMKYLIGLGVADMEKNHRLKLGSEELIKALKVQIALMLSSMLCSFISMKIMFVLNIVFILGIASVIAEFFVIFRLCKTYRQTFNIKE